MACDPYNMSVEDIGFSSSDKGYGRQSMRSRLHESEGEREHEASEHPKERKKDMARLHESVEMRKKMMREGY